MSTPSLVIFLVAIAIIVVLAYSTHQNSKGSRGEELDDNERKRSDPGGD